MTVVIVATSDHGPLIARGPNGDFLVLSLASAIPVGLGDELVGTLDGTGPLVSIAQNVTRETQLRVCLENWGMSLRDAVNFFLSITPKGSPISAGNKRFTSDSDNVARNLCAEISDNSL